MTSTCSGSAVSAQRSGDAVLTTGSTPPTKHCGQAAAAPRCPPQGGRTPAQGKPGGSWFAPHTEGRPAAPGAMVPGAPWGPLPSCLQAGPPPSLPPAAPGGPAAGRELTLISTGRPHRHLSESKPLAGRGLGAARGSRRNEWPGDKANNRQPVLEALPPPAPCTSGCGQWPFAGGPALPTRPGTHVSRLGGSGCRRGSEAHNTKPGVPAR